MKIIDIIKANRPSLSFEVFPPKTSDKYESVASAVSEIAKLSPSYMSVTYGAGGGTSKYTAQIARDLTYLGVTSLAHLTCISSSKNEVKAQLAMLKELGIENILALRGDIPEGIECKNLDFTYAYQLIDIIKNEGGFCIGGACYPECHPESESVEKDIYYLRNKVEHGCDFLTTQMFFDNEIFYRFAERLSKNNINVPIVAGIMPITSPIQVEKMIKISGSALPDKLVKLIDKYEHDAPSFKAAGIEYASMQARDIFDHNFVAVHIYSMNKPDVAQMIKNNLKDILE